MASFKILGYKAVLSSETHNSSGFCMDRKKLMIGFLHKSLER